MKDRLVGLIDLKDNLSVLVKAVRCSVTILCMNIFSSQVLNYFE